IALVAAAGVVVAEVLGHDRAPVLFTGDEHPGGAVGPYRACEALGVSVRSWAAGRDPHDLEARIVNGSPAPGDGELSDLAWFAPAELPGLQLSRFSRALLHPTARLGPICAVPGPVRQELRFRSLQACTIPAASEPCTGRSG